MIKFVIHRIFHPKNLTLTAILMAAFLVLSPCLGHDFLYWDDDVHAWNNPNIKRLSAENLKQIFTGTINKTYIPLTTLSFAVEYAAVKDTPFSYHLTNLLLHLGVTALLFTLAIKLGLNIAGAGLAALIFAIHPIHVESVAWVTERKDVLYALFYLGGLLSFIHYTRQRQCSAYLFSMIFCLLSMLAKPMALSFPLVLFILDHFLKRTLSFKTAIEKIPFFLITAPLAWITYSLHARMPIHDGGTSFLTWVWTFTFYIKKFIWPFNLGPLYELPKPLSISNPQFSIPLIIVMIIVWSLFRFRRHPWYIFAWGIYIASIFFILRFDHTLDTEITADRFMYLPSFGFCLCLGFGISKLLEKDVRHIFFIAPLVIFLGLTSFKQTQIWKNDLTLWQHVLKINPASPIAYNNMGNYFYKKKDFDKALANYTQAIKLAPGLFSPYSNRGVIYFSQTHYTAALNDFNAALHLKEDPVAYNNRGSIYLTQLRLDEALADFNQSLKLNPYFNAAWYNRGEVFRLKNEKALAIESYTRALELNPLDKDSLTRLKELQ